MAGRGTPGMCPTPFFALICVWFTSGDKGRYIKALYTAPHKLAACTMKVGLLYNSPSPGTSPLYLSPRVPECTHRKQQLSCGTSMTSRTSSWSRFTSQNSSTCISGPVQPLACSLDSGGTPTWSAGSSTAHYPPGPGRNRTAGLLWFCLVRPFRCKLLVATVQHVLLNQVAVRENKGTCSRYNKPLQNQFSCPDFSYRAQGGLGYYQTLRATP